MDQSVMVRCSCINGVCCILSYYWEMIPAHVIRDISRTLINELAFDTASSDIRVAVLQVRVEEKGEEGKIVEKYSTTLEERKRGRVHYYTQYYKSAFLLFPYKGMGVVLDQRLSHPFLKESLPVLGRHLHDRVEKVRIAFLDLLILIKGMRAIKV